MSLIESMDKFHAHLDECEQCRDHPFGLCPSGSALLLATADDGAVVRETPDAQEKVE